MLQSVELLPTKPAESSQNFESRNENSSRFLSLCPVLLTLKSFSNHSFRHYYAMSPSNSACPLCI